MSVNEIAAKWWAERFRVADKREAFREALLKRLPDADWKTYNDYDPEGILLEAVNDVAECRGCFFSGDEFLPSKDRNLSARRCTESKGRIWRRVDRGDLMRRISMPRQPNALWQPIFLALMCRRREVRGKGYARVQLNKDDFAKIILRDENGPYGPVWQNIRTIKFPVAEGEWDHITHVIFYQAGKRIGPQFDQPLPFKKPRATDAVVFPAGSLTLHPEAFLNHEHTRP